MSTMFDSAEFNGREGRHLGAVFPSPFYSMATTAMPRTIRDAIRLCEFIASNDGTYREAIRRKIAHFITDIDVTGEDLDREEREQYKTYILDDLDILSSMFQVEMDREVYGNSFAALLLPLRRMLGCPRCWFTAPAKNVMDGPAFKFKWQMPEFHATCPKCGHRGSWKRHDALGSPEDRPVIKTYPPQDIEIVTDPFSGRSEYYWKIPEEDRLTITQGRADVLATVNWEIVEAVEANQLFKFDNGMLLHIKEPTLSGIRNAGWGIPPILANFRQAWYVQVIKRQNETIASDFCVPFRLITPATRAGATPETSDPLLSMGGGNWGQSIRGLLRRHAVDPGAWHTLPFPVQYQALGAEANQLAPFQLLDQGVDALLTAAGIPVEMYKMNLTQQNAPAAIRLFESSQSHIPHGLNALLRFVIRQLVKFKKWEDCKATLAKSAMFDDVNRASSMLQLMTGQQISKETGLSTIGIASREETKKMLEEQLEQADMQEKAQEQQDGSKMQKQLGAPQPQAQGGGQPAPGGAAPLSASMGATSMTATTPEEQTAKATAIAQELMALPDAQCTSRLIQLKRSDPTIHPYVKQLLGEMRDQARSQGGEMVMQQQYGKSGSVLAEIARGSIREIYHA